MAKPLIIDEVWVDRIKQILNGLEYGMVQIVVHDGKIAQIDRTERKRFEGSSQAEKSSSKKQKEIQPTLK
ncbi:YezD family protein [Paenibacillus sp. GP183]|jgi:hypothetical protein|uniref:YezD family protein n=1 Tax=Paenibacillus sp. GP183 TaxID=1882751 RepID=UPI000898C3A5|nr:YezD family protein [Paenibacillus sp. GP183]SEB56504.1 hypothetical protein SAMN05443246_1101 [Paenibacillus sp. GP183]